MRDFIPINKVARPICGIQNQSLFHRCVDGDIEWKGDTNYHSDRCLISISSFLNWLKTDFAWRDELDFEKIERYLKAYESEKTSDDYYYWKQQEVNYGRYLEPAD